MNFNLNLEETQKNTDLFSKDSQNLIQISICFNETTWKSYSISPELTINQLKLKICESENLDPSKIRIRMIEENSGITAFRQLNESGTISQSKILNSSKLSFDKTTKRVVRFVESDEEHDKVVEISTKHKSSTVPSTSCHSDSHDLSEVELEPKKVKKQVKLKIKKLKKILKNLKVLEKNLNSGSL